MKRVDEVKAKKVVLLSKRSLKPQKGLNAPRLTAGKINSVIKQKQFHVFEAGCLTVCCLTLTNGFTVLGESSCASPEIGEKIAFENARNKIWSLECYV